MILVIAAFYMGLIAGAWWATRAPEPLPPEPRRLRKVARPCLVGHAPDGEPLAIAADFVALRADFDPSARRELDTLVLLDALWQGGKW